MNHWTLRFFAVLSWLGCLTMPSYSQTPQEKEAAWEAIAAKWDSLPGLDRDADNQELLTFVRTLPQFTEADIVTGSSSVWARFNDGRTLIIANNLPVQPPPAVGSPAQSVLGSALPPASHSDRTLAVGALVPSPTELPASNRARLLHLILGYPTAVLTIKPWLVSAGYDVVDDVAEGTLPMLRTNVHGDGIFYIEAHGAVVRLQLPVTATAFAVSVGDDADFNLDLTGSDLALDMDAGRVTYMGTIENFDVITGKYQKRLRYAITAEFVKKYWSFGPNSFVFLDACESDITAAQDFKTAIFDKGGSVYAGWTADVNMTFGVRAARLVFDRLLGTNIETEIHETDFAQRSFDYISIKGDLPLHNLGTDPYKGAQLNFTPNTVGGDFGSLAPSIASELTNEVNLGMPPYTAGTLEISGIFGTDPRPDLDSKVTVGGVDCPIKPGADGWQLDTIRCDLSAGAAGDVVVTVRKHDSNKARLTKWNGTFDYSIAGDGSLKVSANYHAAFRSDVRKFRGVIHNPPIGPFFAITGLIPEESSGSYTCSGSATYSEPDFSTTVTWTGGGNMSASRVAPPGPNSFQFTAATSLPTVKFISYYGPGPGCDWTRVTVTHGGTFTESGHWDLSWPGLVDIGALPVEPNDPSFPAGSMNFASCGSPPTAMLTFNSQCRMQWGTIAATFPPDATSAR